MTENPQAPEPPKRPGDEPGAAQVEPLETPAPDAPPAAEAPPTAVPPTYQRPAQPMTMPIPSKVIPPKPAASAPATPATPAVPPQAAPAPIPSPVPPTPVTPAQVPPTPATPASVNPTPPTPAAPQAQAPQVAPIQQPGVPSGPPGYPPAQTAPTAQTAPSQAPPTPNGYGVAATHTPAPATAVPSVPPTSGKQSKTPLLVGAGVLLAILIGGGLFAVLSRDGGEEASPETTPVVTVAESTTTTEQETTTTTEPLPRTVAELATSTVMVIMTDAGGTPLCFGSGTIIDEQGTILTNAHVVANDTYCPYSNIQIAVTDDSGIPPVPAYEADLLAVDIELDLAVVRAVRNLDGSPANATFTPTVIGDSDAVQIGDDIRILGYPSIGGDTITFTNGSVSGFTAQAGVGDRSWIKTDATIAGGNSGGTAVNDAGELIGIPTQGGASSESPIVDCRVLTDTNGDGIVNGQDQCVPFGGFLNGIRPVNLALPLLEDARTATPITFTPEAPTGDINFDDLYFYLPGFSLAVPDDPSQAQFVVTASSEDTDLCFWIAWEGMVPGASWDAVWVVNDEIDMNRSLFDQKWSEASEGTDFWVCAEAEEGFTPGLYEVAFLVEGEIVFIEAIEITAAPVPVHTVTFVNATSDRVCYLAVNPDGASDVGLDELGSSEILDIGDTKDLRLPTGTMIAQGFDCNGEAVSADYSTIVVDGDATIEITN